MRSRRAVLGGTLVGIGGVVAWGLRGAVGSPDATGSEPTLRPGEATTLSVEATNVGALHVSTLPDRERVRVDLLETRVSPSPTTQEDSYPPYWYWWRPRQSVAVEVPVSVTDDAPAGAYRYGVTVWDGTDRESADSTSAEFEITVVGE